ncbi:garp protein [Cryptosporidium bovis]|uniref:garp protein n=1 Tax=Cryptosporidium bovis TaxID=310047 RepID=UPI00351A120C|nr:garp protein [Cryptosporidium bovis]
MRTLKKCSFFLLFVIQYVLINLVVCSEDAEYSGMRGLAKERIQQFEKIIRENAEQQAPVLEVVRRKKPFIEKFPMTDPDKISVSEADIFDESVEYSDEDELSHKSEDETSLPSVIEDDIVVTSEIDKPFAGEAKEDAEPGDIMKIEIDDHADISSSGETSENIQTEGDDSEKEIVVTKPTKDELKKKKMEEKRLQKERQREEKRLNKLKKEEEKRRKAEEKKSKKGETEGRKDKIRSIFKRRNVCVGGGPESELCVRNGRKLLEESEESSTGSLSTTVDTSSESSDQIENEYNGMLSDGGSDFIIEKRGDYGIDESNAEDESSDEEIMREQSEYHEAEKLYSSLNDSDFKTERISSEEAFMDNDSDYIESIRRDDNDDSEEGSGRKKFSFSEESEEIISKERAVEPLEDIEIESLTDVDEFEGNLGNDVRQKKFGSNADFLSNEASEASNLDDLEEPNSGSDVESSFENRDMISSINEINESDDEENGANGPVDANLTDRDGDHADSGNRITAFLGKIKDVFKKKPNLTPNKKCSTTKCVGRGTKNRLKYTKDFVPQIYLLSRDVPKNELYNVPEISSRLRSESNRMVFAYQLIDGNLMPSSSLASGSRSFITRRWGKRIQTKLVKLRSEFDKLKDRLSEMYHDGVVRGEFELFIEEIDDLTIMLYLAAKEFPSSTKYSNIAKDILRFPEVVASPGERLLSIFRNVRRPSSKCDKGRCASDRESPESLEVKRLKKRMKFIKKRYSSLN